MTVSLVLNVGSSGLKFSLFDIAPAEPKRLYTGAFDRGRNPRQIVAQSASGVEERLDLDEPGNMTSALQAVLSWCEKSHAFETVTSVGHRIVHGGLDYIDPVILDDQAVADLRRLEPLAPLHQPFNLQGVKLARAMFEGAPQVACFDTAFHRSHPFENDTFALPHQLYEEGIRRYGFHGLSYTYVSSRLFELRPDLKDGRVIIAHLGNGASMCALLQGQSVGSTMGFSALDGLPMGTRCGQIDPGVLLYLLQEKGMSVPQLTELLYKQSGLKGLSGLSNDMRQLLDSPEVNARRAIDYFVFRIRREVGGMVAVLGGLDALVFTGGIGENAPEIRARVCEPLKWLGLDLDERQNGNNMPIISASKSKVELRVVPTDEESVIASAAKRLLR
ncbi:MAG: acetate/propionate family kinase [Pseudomonadota bacterium]